MLSAGTHLMRTGLVEANLLSLNEEAKLPCIADLVRLKLAGPEKAILKEAELSYYENQYKSLLAKLEAEHACSRLPESPSEQSQTALNNLLIRIRLGGRGQR